MSFSVGAWELVQVLAKIVMYAGMAAASGGMLVLCLLQREAARLPATPENPAAAHWCQLQYRVLLRQCAWAATAGLLATLLLFLLQVGSISQNGLPGMLDPLLLRVLAATPVGTGTAFKLAGFVLALLVMLLAALRVSAGDLRVLSIGQLLANASALLLFALSFAVVGHASALGLFVQLAAGVHVIAVLLWIGALQPLRKLNATGDTAILLPLLRTFGVLGWSLVGCLLLGGSVMLWQMLGRASDLLTTVYGGLMLAKLQMASCLLGLAALNKFRLVPGYVEKTRPQLQTSIGLELVLALLIIVLTATLTTLTGPPLADAAHLPDI
jgi:putative copper resistance protein D